MKPRARVLLVDDEPAMTRLLGRALDETGEFEVRTANSGIQGLAEFERFAPHVVLLDVVMPDLRGTDVLAELRRAERVPPYEVIFLTAAVPWALERDGAQLEGCRCLIKPVRAADAIAAIREALQSQVVGRSRSRRLKAQHETG